MCVYLVNNITALKDVNLFGWICTAFLLLAAIVYGAELIGKFFKMIGKPLKWKKNRETDHDLILKNSEAIKALAELHKKDCDNATAKSNQLREELNIFMSEVRNDIKQFAENRINDREKSRSIQTEINERINSMAETDRHRDETVSLINENLSRLTNMFIDKQINDYRWEIINFATAISEKKPCTKDGFKHCFATYEKYEKVLEEHGLENGEVEISMEIINEAYKEKMKNGEF